MTRTGSLPCWARLRTVGPVPLRRGAWYRVTALTAQTVAIEVNGQPLVLPPSMLEVVEHRPDRWTVVPRPHSAPLMLPESWGQHYGVCPNCAHRAPLFGVPTSLVCIRCGLRFLVAWEERYFGRKRVSRARGKSRNAAQRAAWHAEGHEWHHVHVECELGNSITPDERIAASGGKPLCHHCAWLLDAAEEWSTSER